MKKLLTMLCVFTAAHLNAQKQWTFSGSSDGWGDAHDVNTRVTVNGTLLLQFTGSDPYIVSPVNLGLSTTTYGQVRIKLQNQSNQSSFKLFWTTTSDNNWSESKSMSFNVSINDAGLKEYVVNTGTSPAWTGTIARLRLDVGDASTGSVALDQVDVEPAWIFNTSKKGWTEAHSLTGTMSNNNWRLNITGADPFITSPDNLNLNAVSSGPIRIRLRNMTPDSDFQLFWTTTADGNWSESKSIRFRAYVNQTNVTEYVINTIGVWGTGTIKRLRLDVGNNSTSGVVLIEKIEIRSGGDFELNNGTIRVTQDLTQGGAITHVSKAYESRNLVNTFDRGRCIQQSYYAGNVMNRQADGQSPSWSPWSWNPIQAGDFAGNRANIISFSKEVNRLYVKCTPMLWDMNNKPAEAIMEQWTTITGRIIHVRNKLTCMRTDNIYGEGVLNDQEIPAVYPISALKNLFTYNGSEPFVNRPVNQLTVVNLSSGFWGVYESGVTEKWMAFVDDNRWGMGVYSATATKFLAGMAGSPGGETSSPSTSYISPVRQERLMKNSVMEYEYYIIIGTVEEIRSSVYAIRNSGGGANVMASRDGHEEEVLSEQALKIYPNPGSASVSVEMPEMDRIQLLNMQGQVVKEVACNGCNQTELNINHLPRGSYLMKARSKKNVATAHFIKDN